MCRKDAGRCLFALLTTLALLLPGSRCRRPDIARYVLPAGSFGGLPSQRVLDRPAPPLRRPDPAARKCLTRRHRPVLHPGELQSGRDATTEDTGRAGLTIIRDAYGIPHIRGKTRADVFFGSGWVTARGPRAAAAARARARPRGGRRRARRERLRPRHQRPLVRPERRRRSAGHHGSGSSRRTLRRQGPADAARLAGLRRRRQRRPGSGGTTSRRGRSTT